PNIMFNLKVLNTGTVDLAAGRLTVRYWFTRDGGTSPLTAQCDYAEIGCSKFLTSFGTAEPPKPTADRYLTVRFNSVLEAGQNSGQIHLRVHKADFSPFNESNDYSRSTNSSLASSMKLTAYLDGQLIWGTPP
ncbi:cellulose 1,4-beta-cellobiosidase, partial [Bacillus halotolerans]|uniref:cellulose binding domain-containing protein n=1 Tax=Bacillus halotolerans TaxID=260554 RepID=UPI00255A2E13